ncbi:MAG TPA: EthD family reductase [Terriglobales bacterium]
MARLVVVYKTPRDGAAFDQHYFGTHIPIAKKIPGLRKFEISQGPVLTPAGSSDFHLVATLHFDDMAAIQKGLRERGGPSRSSRRANLHNRTSVHAGIG